MSWILGPFPGPPRESFVAQAVLKRDIRGPKMPIRRLIKDGTITGACVALMKLRRWLMLGSLAGSLSTRREISNHRDQPKKKKKNTHTHTAKRSGSV